MTLGTIHHTWFDLEETLTVRPPEFERVHMELKYRTYAEVVGKPVTEKLQAEYEALRKEHGSNSAVFRSFGLPSDHWQERFATLDESKYYKPVPEICETLKKLKTIVPISLFTNAKLERTLRTLNTVAIDPAWFTHILSGDDMPERKPALDGFYEMIKRSNLPARAILYVGDQVDKDVRPAKAVGMQTCLVWSTSDQADVSCERFEEILGILP